MGVGVGVWFRRCEGGKGRSASGACESQRHRDGDVSKKTGSIRDEVREEHGVRGLSIGNSRNRLHSQAWEARSGGGGAAEGGWQDSPLSQLASFFEGGTFFIKWQQVWGRTSVGNLKPREERCRWRLLGCEHALACAHVLQKTRQIVAHACFSACRL